MLATVLAFCCTLVAQDPVTGKDIARVAIEVILSAEHDARRQFHTSGKGRLNVDVMSFERAVRADSSNTFRAYRRELRMALRRRKARLVKKSDVVECQPPPYRACEVVNDGVLIELRELRTSATGVFEAVVTSTTTSTLYPRPTLCTRTFQLRLAKQGSRWFVTRERLMETC
jgi:hypothetical protein